MKTRCYFDGGENSLQEITHLLRQHEEVDVVVPGLMAIKFAVNRVTGDIKPVSEKDAEYVKNRYAETLFPTIISSLNDVLSALAQWDLLMQLDKLGDKGIHDIIHKNHFSKPTGMDLPRLSEVNNTLLTIQSYMPGIMGGFFKAKEKTPIQLIVADVLKAYRSPSYLKDNMAEMYHATVGRDEALQVYAIRSTQDVKNIMTTIHQRMSHLNQTKRLSPHPAE